MYVQIQIQIQIDDIAIDLQIQIAFNKPHGNYKPKIYNSHTPKKGKEFKQNTKHSLQLQGKGAKEEERNNNNKKPTATKQKQLTKWQ